jgi:hypothetical protein
MRWKFSCKRGDEVFVSKEGYRVEKLAKETCYSAFTPNGPPLPEIFYYDYAAKAACKDHQQGVER